MFQNRTLIDYNKIQLCLGSNWATLLGWTTLSICAFNSFPNNYFAVVQECLQPRKKPTQLAMESDTAQVEREIILKLPPPLLCSWTCLQCNQGNKIVFVLHFLWSVGLSARLFLCNFVSRWSVADCLDYVTTASTSSMIILFFIFYNNLAYLSSCD